ncbi:hypothetical protein BS78_02G169700 [Paspalum vaginatum]|nr:hypothetical protein BS78_02G169700 [Paspalum vaginatum]
MAGARRFLAAREVAASAGGVPVPRASLEDPAPGPAADVPPPPPAPSAAASRITPAVLFVTVVLAVVLLVSGLLHVLRRLFLKTHHAGAGAGERQLQHLFFPANDDGGGGGAGGSCGGLGQAAIDALPEFAYAELSGASANPAGAGAAAASRKGKEKAARPFDCAVCLCEFAAHDRLRLLPPCGHAFHVACIDVWLRSSATCPLCRTKLSKAAAAAPSAGNDAGEDESKQQQQDQQAPSAEPASSVVLPVRLGRFQIADADADADADAAESSTGTSSRINARRCYSMGSYQYVLADEHLLVSVHVPRHGNAGAAAAGGSGDQQQQQPGRKVFARGDSFSVSKIWQWRGSRRLPGALCADDGLPWAPAAKDGGDRSAANARPQHGDT